MATPAPTTIRAKKMTRMRAITTRSQSAVSSQKSEVSWDKQGGVLRGVVQVVLQDHRGGDRIEFTALAQTAHVAALGTGDLFGRFGAEPFVPHLHGDADDAFSNAGEVLGAAGLA